MKPKLEAALNKAVNTAADYAMACGNPRQAKFIEASRLKAVEAKQQLIHMLDDLEHRADSTNQISFLDNDGGTGTMLMNSGRY